MRSNPGKNARPRAFLLATALIVVGICAASISALAQRHSQTAKPNSAAQSAKKPAVLHNPNRQAAQAGIAAAAAARAQSDPDYARYLHALRQHDTQKALFVQAMRAK